MASDSAGFPDGGLPADRDDGAVCNSFSVVGTAAGVAGALTSAQYAFDFNEVKAIGSRSNSTCTAEQAQIAFFWDDNGGVQWNRIAVAVAAQHHNTLSENARLVAVLNIALADAGIAGYLREAGWVVSIEVVQG